MEKIKSTDEAWESRRLGADENYVSVVDDELEEDGLSELDFDGQHYIDNTTDDQNRDLEDYYKMVDSGVDDSDEDPLSGFQIHNFDDDAESDL